jgi:hypothetical protein
MMAWRIQPWLLLAFLARSPCLLGAVVWWVQVCRNNACRQCSLLYFSLIYIYYRIYFLVIPIESSDKILLELRPFDFFQLRKWWCYSVDPESLLSLFFLLLFLWIRAVHCILSLMLPLLCRRSMYSLSYGYLIFFRWRNLCEKVCDPESLLSLIFLLHFFEFVFRIVFAL